MEEQINPLKYFKGEVKDPAPRLSNIVELTLNEGLNDGSVAHICIQPMPFDFINLHSFTYQTAFQLRHLDNTLPEPGELINKKVCLDPEGMHAAFASTEVRFNDKSVSTMTNYPPAVALIRSLGMSQDVREKAWNVLEGSYPIPDVLKSNLETRVLNNPGLEYQIGLLTNPDGMTLTGRIWCDVFTSARQLLPPGVKLDLFLRRALDTATLCSNDPEIGKKYKLYLKTLKIRFETIPLSEEEARKAKEAAAQGGGITFVKLSERTHTVSANSHVYSWLNALDGAPLPNRIYVTFINTKSLAGSITHMGTYFEHANLERLQFRLNGRDVLARPIRCKFVTKSDGSLDLGLSDCREGYMSILNVLEQVEDPTLPLRLSYKEFMQGRIAFALEFGRCGYKSGARGSLDVLCEFNSKGTPFEVGLVLWTESTMTVRL